MVELFQAGASHVDIAKQLKVATKTVQRGLARYFETDCRFPVGIDATQAEAMRTEQREHAETAQRRLLSRIDRLHRLEPEDAEAECMISNAIAKASDSVIKASDHLASMFGLHAPRGDVNRTTNNNLIVIDSPEGALLKMLSQKVPKEIYEMDEAPLLLGEVGVAGLSAHPGGEGDYCVAE